MSMHGSEGVNTQSTKCILECGGHVLSIRGHVTHLIKWVLEGLVPMLQSPQYFSPDWRHCGVAILLSSPASSQYQLPSSLLTALLP